MTSWLLWRIVFPKGLICKFRSWQEGSQQHSIQFPAKWVHHNIIKWIAWYYSKKAKLDYWTGVNWVSNVYSSSYLNVVVSYQSYSLWQLGIFLNTVKRILDVLHCRVEAILKSWASYLPLTGDKKSLFGEQMNGITVMLRTKYKNYLQATVEKLVNNVSLLKCFSMSWFLYENYSQYLYKHPGKAIAMWQAMSN